MPMCKKAKVFRPEFRASHVIVNPAILSDFAAISGLVVPHPPSHLFPLSMRYILLFAVLEICNVAAGLRSGKHCFDGCELTLNYVDFNDTDHSLSRKIR